MFKKFLLFKKDQYHGYAKSLSQLFDLYNSRKPSLETSLNSFLDGVINKSKELNDEDLMKHAQTWKSIIVTAIDSTNPFTLEKVKLYKNTFKNGVYYKVLNDISTYFIAVIAQLESHITKSTDLITQMLLAGIQMHVLKTDSIKKKYNSDEVKALWTSLSQVEQIRLFQYNILLLIGIEDALHLFESGLVRMSEN
jgi:hypothetical protein